jgi:hypothetical protein
MESCHAVYRRTIHRRTLAASLAAAVLAVVLGPSPAAATGGKDRPPDVPREIEIPEGHVPFLVARAAGTQNYMCLRLQGVAQWAPIGPQATLFDGADRQILTHFLSLNPLEPGTARATWQDSRDTSTVWALVEAGSSDPAFVEPGAVAWLRLRVVGRAESPTGGHRLTRTTFIHRVDTTGGQAPSTGCSQDDDLNNRAFVPYTADYVFYAPAKHANE